MMSESLVNGLNEQMNFEFMSSHVYLAMAAYCSGEGWDGFANFYLVQAEEERFHAMKIYNFLNDRGHRATITGMETPRKDFSSMLDVFEKAYDHEQLVTKRIYDLSDMAMDEREHATMSLLRWFIDEQVEEEALFDNIIHKLKRITEDSNAFFMMDEEFAKRSFTPEGE